MKRLYIFTIICILGLLSCSQARKIEIDLDKDIIKIFEQNQWTKRSSKYTRPRYIGYFTNNSSLIISASYLSDNPQPSYVLQVTNRKIILIPYNFPSPEIKEKSRLFEIIVGEEGIDRIYGNHNLKSLLRKNEYPSKAVRISQKKLAMILIYNTNMEPGGPGYYGYLGFYDGQKLERVYLSISNEPITLHGITSWIYYDNIGNKLYVSGKYKNVDKMGKEERLFEYSFKNNTLKEIYSSGEEINSMRRIANTDYLIFWNDGVVLKRIEK
jgi:hypothetical protein